MSLVVPADAKSWVEVDADSHFPIQNLPFGLACLKDDTEVVVVRIGDHVLNLCALSAEGILPQEDFPILHSLIDLDKEDISRLRHNVYDLLRSNSPHSASELKTCEGCLVPFADVQMLVPVEIPSFVDFYSGINHASNVGRMFRPDMPSLLPNYRTLPVAYNGRASSVLPSDLPIVRPRGIFKPDDATLPIYAPTRELDFELELGYFLSDGNEMWMPISVAEAEEHILGLVLVNDWSARDVQRFEYQPLGPFLGKSFATSISPWIVTLDALEPFRVEGPAQEPAPLPHLQSTGPAHFDIQLEVALQSRKMTKPQVVTRTNARELYWSFAQQVAHQSSNGTLLETGDLYATGTISGEKEGSFGSMLELTWRGTQPITLQETGELRSYLEDGDTVIITGYCQGDGFRVGLGEVRAQVQPAR